MKYVKYLLFAFIGILLLSFGKAQASSISLESVNFWSLETEVGSGLDIGDDTFDQHDQQTNNYLPPNSPAERSLPDSQSIEASSSAGYALAEYEVNNSSIEVSVNGWATSLGPYVEWYKAYSKVIAQTETFSSAPAFLLKIDWQIDQNAGMLGDTKFTANLVDATNSSIIDSFVLTYDYPSNVYSWYVSSLDPTHTYYLDLEAYVYLEGEDQNSFGSSYFTTKASILEARTLIAAIPEPTTFLLVGLGLLSVGIYSKHRKRKI